MLFIDREKGGPLLQTQARALLAREPAVLRILRAWVDDSELCLTVECGLNDESTISLEMCYCWDDPRFADHNYFTDLVVWLLNGEWSAVYEFVQTRFAEVLTEHATNPAYPQDDEG
jgi:hypothetical protein